MTIAPMSDCVREQALPPKFSSRRALRTLPSPRRGDLDFMSTTFCGSKPFDSCNEIAIGTDPLRQTDAIAHMRREIAREQQTTHSTEDQRYLRIAEMILDFLEEKFELHSCEIRNRVPLQGPANKP
jgi:hypothetical protein